MKYLKGTLDYGLRYASDVEIRLYEFTNLDWEGSTKYTKIASGCCFSLGLGMISWFTIKKSSIALSMTGVEYIATCSACREAIWIRKMLT